MHANRHDVYGFMSYFAVAVRMGDKNNVDTTSFRRAIWNYIHSLFGIRHDDYDYSVVNKLLERPLKAYVKIVTCFPDRVTRADYDAFMQDFNHSEKVLATYCCTTIVICFISQNGI